MKKWRCKTSCGPLLALLLLQQRQQDLEHQEDISRLITG